MRKIHEETDTHVYDLRVGYPLTTAKVTDKQYGYVATGSARCDPTDEYNELFGANLALSRAQNRLYRKLEKHYIRYSKNFTRG